MAAQGPEMGNRSKKGLPSDSVSYPAPRPGSCTRERKPFVGTKFARVKSSLSRERGASEETRATGEGSDSSSLDESISDNVSSFKRYIKIFI